jgi:hypothetical protein
MEGKYTHLIDSASRMMCEGLLENRESLIAEGTALDRFVLELLRELGRSVMTGLYQALGIILAGEAKGPGYKVRRSPVVEFKTVFGPIEVNSPYLWSREGESARPLKDVFGVEGGGMSEAVDRALTDFGAERSFERAAKSFHEHYGWEVGRTTIRGHTERAAAEAEEFLEQWRENATGEYARPLRERPGVDSMLVELDGCDIRTGEFMTAAEAGRTDCEPDKVVRLEAWREVRTGLVRPLDQVDSTYVCAMAPYVDMCKQLFAAACHRGLSRTTQVVAVADGGQGLREELDAHFPGAQFILDYPHLKSHLYETAEALGFEEDFREEWVKRQADRLWEGHVEDVIADLQRLYEKTECDRLRRLIGHLIRFKDAVHYEHYQTQGWPIGSGEVESAHRYIPQERLKIPGACWRPDTVNPMLALRVVRANGFWDDFWRWRHERDAIKRAA